MKWPRAVGHHEWSGCCIVFCVDIAANGSIIVSCSAEMAQQIVPVIVSCSAVTSPRTADDVIRAGLGQ